MHTIVQAEAPGSMMLFGEHAVLHGYPALVCAVNRYLRVRLEPCAGRRLVIQSDLGTYTGTIDALESDPRFRFVLAAVKALVSDLPGGCILTIASDFPGTIGLGSSAAATVATLAALYAWADVDRAPERLLEKARAVIQKVQGQGSGADAAASVFGGIVSFRIGNPSAESKTGHPETHPAAPFSSSASDFTANPLGKIHPITVAYAGYKKPTAEVIRHVEQEGRKRPNLYAELLRLIGQTADEAERQLRAGAFAPVGSLMTLAHGLMEALGVGDARLSELVYRVRSLPNVSGAKISGSGLGDCVIGWGRPNFLPTGEEWIPVSMTETGVNVD